MELQFIKQKIHTIRGYQVILDFDLAKLYEVSTKTLKQTVRRNIERFPDDFMFELMQMEYRILRSQIVTLESGRGKHSKYPPFAFTEHGVAMLSGILNSHKAIKTNIVIIRAFIALRKYALNFSELEQQIAKLEARFERDFSDVHEALKWLAAENQARAGDIATLQESNSSTENWHKRKRIGFKKEP
ncbi:MAG: ORF6N domain-containing protein [Saprospiraceae bacterium]